MRQPGHSSLMFVTSPQECDDYAATAKSEKASGEVRHTVIPVHGRQNRECSDDRLCADVDSDEARTYVATDSHYLTQAAMRCEPWHWQTTLSARGYVVPVLVCSAEG